MLNRLLSRRCLIVCILGLVGSQLSVAHPSWAQAVGVDVWNLAELEEQTRATTAHNRVLLAEDYEIQQRIAIKESLIEELVAGHTSLAATTDAFLELNRAMPQHMTVIRSLYPGRSDRELVARNVLDYAKGRSVSDREEQAVQSRLEHELDALIATEPLAAE